MTGCCKSVEEENRVLNYLKSQNRPFSATDIFNNLHGSSGGSSCGKSKSGGSLGKTAVIRVLEQLASKGRIYEKVYGKQKVYAPLQSEFPSMSKEELGGLDKEIARLEGELKRKKGCLAEIETRLRSLKSEMGLKELMETVKRVEKENEVGKVKLEKMKGGRVVLDASECEKVREKMEGARKECRKRKRMASEMINAVLDGGYPKGKAGLFQEVGLEEVENLRIDED